MHSFAAHVTRQVAHPPGATHAAAGEALAHETAVTTALERLVAAAPTGETAAGDADARLAHDPVLLSACFQNLDLLPPADPDGDAIALLVLDAIGRLGDD